jgi:hypothetical protein
MSLRIVSRIAQDLRCAPGIWLIRQDFACSSVALGTFARASRQSRRAHTPRRLVQLA